jgi:hypothetical protein
MAATCIRYRVDVLGFLCRAPTNRSNILRSFIHPALHKSIAGPCFMGKAIALVCVNDPALILRGAGVGDSFGEAGHRLERYGGRALSVIISLQNRPAPVRALRLRSSAAPAVAARSPTDLRTTASATQCAHRETRARHDVRRASLC